MVMHSMRYCHLPRADAGQAR